VNPPHAGTVYLADEQTVDVSGASLANLALHVLAHEGYPDRVEVTILFVDEETIGSYNERFMGREGPTDVLAFPLEPLVAGVSPEVLADDPPINLGDIVIAPSYVARQAEDFGVPLDDELALMVVHGMLHLMGWDHPDDDAAAAMEAREAAVLARVGRSRR
jgi:probable rRNA maturation factor